MAVILSSLRRAPAQLLLDVTVRSDTEGVLTQEGSMAKRYKLSRKKSKKLFRKTASKVHKKNVHQNTILRGGIRL